MSLAQIRRQVNALLRKLAPYLLVYRLRKLVDPLCQQWAADAACQKPAPEPLAVIQYIANAGFRLPTFMSLQRYLDRCRSEKRNPESRQIILALLPWAAGECYQNLLRWDLPAPANGSNGWELPAPANGGNGRDLPAPANGGNGPNAIPASNNNTISGIRLTTIPALY